MKKSRVFRDVLILVLFSGLFYASSVVVGNMESGPAEEESDFSGERIKGDEMLRMKRWGQSAEEFRKMTLDDPYNGYAWFYLGKSYNEMRMKVYDDIELALNSDSTTTQRIDNLKDEVSALNKKAIAAYMKAKDHLRYRFNALFMLAVVYADDGDYDKSLKYLGEFVDRKYVCYHQLDRYWFFGQTLETGERTKLHQYDRFWELVEKHAQVKLERRNRF